MPIVSFYMRTSIFQDFDAGFVKAMDLVLGEFKDRVRFYSEGNQGVKVIKIS